MYFLPQLWKQKEAINRNVYNRGCPHKQNNPVLGQQPAAGGRAPGELLGCCDRVGSPRPWGARMTERGHRGLRNTGLTGIHGQAGLLTWPCEAGGRMRKPRAAPGLRAHGRPSWDSHPGWPTALQSERPSSPSRSAELPSTSSFMIPQRQAFPCPRAPSHLPGPSPAAQALCPHTACWLRNQIYYF